MSATAQLRQLSIEFDEGDVCFAPGDLILGFVVVGVSQQHLAVSTKPFYHPSSDEEKEQQEEAPDSDEERSQCFEILELRMKVHGGARVKGKNRNQTKEQTYLDLEMELIGPINETAGNANSNGEGIINSPVKMADRLVKPGGEKLVKFEFHLPEKGLYTSLESKSASILYVLRVSLTYRNLNKEIRRVNAVRGFSIVECFDLCRLHNHYFQPASHHLVKKFGLFSCTGGQIRLHFSISRTAFVCGENIIIEGRIDNRTDRRVDKVAAVLQQIVVVHGDMKGVNLNLLDVTDIHEDNLALFVDQGTALKIERNFAIPPLPPSSLNLDASSNIVHIGHGGAVEHYLGAHVAIDMARRYRRLSSNTSNHENRFLKVLYQLSVRVKTGGVEVMEINVPILIGNLPPRKMPPPEKILMTAAAPQNTFSRAAMETAASMERGSGGQQLFALSVEEEGEPMALFMHNRKEGSAKLGQSGETYICNRSQLNFTNKYPFFVNLATSSKQSRKVSVLANAIRAENSFVNAIRQEQQQNSGGGGGQQQKKEAKNENEKGKIDGEKSEGIGIGTTSTTETVNSDQIDQLKKVKITAHLPRRSATTTTLPPVEILAEHLGRAGSFTIGTKANSKSVEI